MKEQSVQLETGSRTNNRVYSTEWTQSSFSIIHPLIDFLAAKTLFTIKTSTKAALLNLIPVLEGTPMSLFQY